MRFFGLKPSEIFGGEPRDRPDPGPVDVIAPPEDPSIPDIPDFPTEPIEEVDPVGESHGRPSSPSGDGQRGVLDISPRSPIPLVPNSPAGGLTSRGSLARPGQAGFSAYRGIRPNPNPEPNPRDPGAGAPFVGGGGFGDPNREDVVDAIMSRFGGR